MLALVIALVSAVSAAVAVYFLFPYSVPVGKVRNLLELIALLVRLKYHAFTKNGRVWSFADEFERLVDAHPDVIQFIFVENDQYVSRSALDRQANQIANWAIDDLMLQQKDTVALMMFNRPEFVSFWLGLSKVGVRTALLNTNITGKPFLHSVTVAVQESSSKVVVIDSELRGSLSSEVLELQAHGVKVFYWGDICKKIDSFSAARPDKTRRNEVMENEPFLYIFTSGTTGLPKASKISHTRYCLGALPLTVTCYLRPGSRVYCCLPMYHSAACMLGVGGALASGATLVVRYTVKSCYECEKQCT
jgi:fatty-acyl-CoA synthase